MTWSNDYRCVSCSEEYSVKFDTVRVGPIGMSQIVSSTEESHGIVQLHTRSLYDGEILQVKCPYCHFVCDICIDLDRSTMGRFLQLAAQDWPDYNIEKYFESNCTRFIGFPISCLSRDEKIEQAGQWEKCKFCGSSQLNVIRSYRVC